MDLYNDLAQKVNELDATIRSLRTTSAEYAKAYTTYRVELAKELLRLKEEGMSISLATDVARGQPHIAKAKFNEICKEAIYKANLEQINALKLQIKILNEQLGREWNG